MRVQTTFVSLLLAAALAGCGSVVIQSEPDADGGAAGDAPGVTDRPPVEDRPVVSDGNVVLDRPTPIDVGRGCTRTSDCSPGQECIGGEGCDIPWTCQPQFGRACTDDIAPFCGCDGATFTGSSSCPQRPYAHPGPCEMPPPPIDAGPPGCALPDGRVCPVGAMCRTECAVCYCAPSGELRCTGVGCVDAGPPPRPCTSNSECAGGTQCVGPEGCGVPWTCQPVTGCTRDLAAYCACDGTSFYGSSTCPGHPYRHRGECGIVPPPIDAGAPTDVDLPPVCPAQDARGVGMCAAFFGYAWNGAQCVGLGGCSCAGVDCRSLSLDQGVCERAHLRCPRPL